MILGKIVVSGPDAELNNGVVDAVFAYLKAKNQPAIFLENYDPKARAYIVGDTFLVCLAKTRVERPLLEVTGDLPDFVAKTKVEK